MKRNMKSIFLLISALCLILGFTITPSSSNAAEKTPGFDLLKGSKAKQYEESLLNSDVYQDNISKEKLENVQVALFEKSERLPEDVVIVSGSIGGDVNNAVQAFIHPEDKRVIKVTNLKATGLTDTDTFVLKAYDSKGLLRATSEGTIKEMKEGTAKVEREPIPDDSNASVQKVDQDAIWWACQFSSFLVCMGAAGVNILLGFACRMAFKMGAC